MADRETWETTDVVICGCGPTGAMLSGYLGKFGISNIVLEREAEITTDPRGIALDEEGIRLVQGLGIYDRIFSEIGTCMQQFQFVGGKAHDLSNKPFMLMDYATTEGGTGHVGFICHKQPMLEKNLRMAMAATGYSELRSQATVNDISVDEQWVYCRYTDANGVEKRLRSKFFVGADGKTGFTRKRYLEERGIKMETISKTTYDETWVALNWRISPPTPETHPNFPLWKLGYTPEDVYDTFFPVNFRFLCNPIRPSVCGRFGLPSDRLWRFEFVVLDGEDGQEMASPAMIEKVVAPYLKHRGSRYGLPEDVEYPSDCIEVLRCRPFKFSARSCNRWADGRVMVCGDAAHVFPPFGGQGIASGFRDAASLAWRLAIGSRLDKPDAAQHARLFNAWYFERKQQLERSLASTIENGNFVTERNPVKIFIRDWYLWLLQQVPSCRHRLHLGNRREGMTQYGHQPGMPFIPTLGGGRCFPQVYCQSLSVNGKQNQVQFTDDVIWRAGSSAVFRLVLLVKSVAELDELLDIVRGLPQFEQGGMTWQDVTIIVEDTAASMSKNIEALSNDGLAVYRIASADEFALSSLCNGRPKPQGYDPYRMGTEVKNRKLVFLRPDRFVFAACNTKDEAHVAAAEMAALLKGSSYRL